MEIKVLVFGQLTDITGSSELSLSNFSTSEELLEMLVHKYPSLADSKFAMALNKQVITQNTTLPENSIVALLPPFSGG